MLLRKFIPPTSVDLGVLLDESCGPVHFSVNADRICFLSLTSDASKLAAALQHVKSQTFDHDFVWLPIIRLGPYRQSF